MGYRGLQATDTGRLTGDVTDPAGKGVTAVAFGPDGTLAAVDKNGRVYLWRIRAGRRG